MFVDSRHKTLGIKASYCICLEASWNLASLELTIHGSVLDRSCNSVLPLHSYISLASSM